MRADGVLVTWCLRRNIVAALLASAGVVAAASFLPVVVPTPQLRGGGLEAATALLTSFAVAMCFVPTITAGDLALEERSPRPVRAARIGFGALLLGVTAALVAVGVLVRGGDAAGVAAAVRTLSLASALGLAAARLGGLVAGFAVGAVAAAAVPGRAAIGRLREGVSFESGRSAIESDGTVSGVRSTMGVAIGASPIGAALEGATTATGAASRARSSVL